MLSSMDSWLAWRTVRLGISTARPVSVLLWMAPFSLRPSPSRNKKGVRQSAIANAAFCSDRVKKQRRYFRPSTWHPGSILPSRSILLLSLHQQLPVTFGTNPVLQQARAQQKPKTHTPPHLLQPFVPINYAQSAGAHRPTSWLHMELLGLGSQHQHPWAEPRHTACSCLKTAPKSHVAASDRVEQQVPSRE